jgi:hypothetical protein
MFLTNAIRVLSGIRPRNALLIETSWAPELAVKTFNLSMCNRIICYAFHSKNIRMSKKKRGLQFNLSDKKSSV